MYKAILDALRNFNNAIRTQSLDRAFRFTNAAVREMMPTNVDTTLSIGDIVAIANDVRPSSF